MEWQSPSHWTGSPEAEMSTSSACRAEHTTNTPGNNVFAPRTAGAAAAAATHNVSAKALTTGEAMDAVAEQCERRGLTNAATWLSEISLHATPSILAAPLPVTSSLMSVVKGVDASLVATGSAAAAAPYQQRLHRMALGYFTKGEFQRCHQIILREVMRNTGNAESEGWSAAQREGVGAAGSLNPQDNSNIHNDTQLHTTAEVEVPHGSSASSSPTAAAAATATTAVHGAGPSLPAPAVVRGFRTTTLPPLLQFLCLYALFMDGMKAKQLSNNANAGSGGGGLQRALHPHARVLRAYLLEAMRNPVNFLPPPGAACSPGDAAASPPRAPADDSKGDDEAVQSEGQNDTAKIALSGHADSAGTAGVVEGWDPHTPSVKKQPWTTSSASRVPGVKGTVATTTTTTTFAAASASAMKLAEDASTVSSSSVGSHGFSNFSPSTIVKPQHPGDSPEGEHGVSPLPGITRHHGHGSSAMRAGGNAAAAAAARRGGDGVEEATASADLLHMDPYLTWLMGVVLRELRMRQACATFLLAAVTVNPLLRCAWEDLTSLVSREAQLAELDAALDGVEPFFMTDIFAAEVRGLLGVTPVSSSRLRGAAASVGAASNFAAFASSSGGMGGGEKKVDAAAPLSAASPQALNGASPVSVGSMNSGLVGGGNDIGGGLRNGSPAAGVAPASPSGNPNSNGHTASAGLPAAVLANAWECLNVLFPDTPSLLSHLAHFYYHQRNRLDKAEAIYQRIRKLDPNYYGILYDYSNMLYTKRDRLGLSSLVQAVYHADAFRAETNFAVGNYYVLLGQHDRAALHFHRTTAIDPQCAEAWLLLGHAYVEVKNTTAAVEAYRTAVELNERDYRGWYNLGQIYELLEAYHHALYYYWHTTSLRPADPGMWVAVANCLEHDGRVAESIACLERAETYDANTSPNYPAYVRRIATHHIANSSFTRACVYLEKLAQSPAATGEDLLLALPFLIQHYVQRARKSMEVSARSASYDPALFSPGIHLSPASSPSSASAGRTALYHARAAAALQHLHKAEEHLAAMADLVMPVGATLSPTTATTTIRGEDPNASYAQQQQQQQRTAGLEGEGEGAPMAGLENYTDEASARRRAKPSSSGGSAGGSGVYRPTAAASAAAVEELPPVTFVRTRHHEISTLRAQAMQVLHPSVQQQQQQQQQQASPSATAGTASSSAGSGRGAEGQQKNFFTARTR